MPNPETAPVPSQPLANSRHEIYATGRAKGLPQAESWRKTVPFGQVYNGSNTSLRVSGHRVEQRPEVRARIDWLTKAARGIPKGAPEHLSRADIVKASLEVSEALETAYKAAQSSSTSPQAIERLKSVWAAHLARQGKLDETHEPLPHGDDAMLLDMVERIQNLQVCMCPKL